MKGNQRKFHSILNEIIDRSDVVIEVVDARFINETRNKAIEEKITGLNKALILAINKCDLVNKDYMDRMKKILRKELDHVIFLSAHKHLGTTMLKKLIIQEGFKSLHTRNMDDIRIVKASVIGYPNTGKSSVINALSGRKKAKTSSKSGFTVGYQNARATPKLTLIDTPGVIPYGENDETELVMVASVEPSRIKDPEYATEKIIEKFPEEILSYYKLLNDFKAQINDNELDTEEALEKIALKLKKLMPGGKPDIKTASRKILTDWQQGKIILHK